jgi:hypothetical protein
MGAQTLPPSEKLAVQPKKGRTQPMTRASNPAISLSCVAVDMSGIFD